MSMQHSPTAFEQMMLEYINRARTDPAGEFDALIADADSTTAVQSNITQALRFFGVDLNALRAQFDALSAAPPLAWNGALADAATVHTQLMIEFDQQSHRLPGELSLGARIDAAGYGYSRVAENVFAYTRDPLHGHAGFFIDWGYDAVDDGKSDHSVQGDGIQDAAGHRVAIMQPGHAEIGIAAIDDSADDATDRVGPYALTQNFGNRRDYEAQLLGVVFDDADGDRSYDIGEGLGGITVTAAGAAGTFATTTWDVGGYQLALPDGIYTVTLSGAELAGAVSFSVEMAGRNVKHDAIAGDAVVREGVTPEPDSPTGSAGREALIDPDGRGLLHGDTLPVSAVPEIAGQVYRLYLATLGREPDAEGLQDWAALLLQGMPYLQAVQGFTGSAEFQRAHSDLADETFVALLYDNVLGRPGSPAEIQTWLDLIVTPGLSRDEVVQGFAESAEFRLQTAQAAARFATDHTAPEWQDDVYRLYQATLDRAPDLSGFLGWMEALGGGRDYLDAAGAFVNSAEWQARYGDLSDSDFVAQLYRNVLDRDPDAAGLQGWLDLMADGGSRTEVVQGLAQSVEFATATALDVTTWIRQQGTNDVLNGGTGDTLLAGGALSDSFVFGPSAGRHTVLDLEPWDVIDLQAFGYAGVEEARAQLSCTGSDLVFADAGVIVTFSSTQPGGVTDDMLLI